MLKTILSICIFFYGFYPLLAAGGDQTPQPVEWQSTLPGVSDLNTDLKEVENLIKDKGQFIFRRDPQPITSWTTNGEKTYPVGVVVTAMRIVHVPVEKVKTVLKDYSLLNKIQRQHTNVKFVSQRGSHTLYSFDQVYKLGVITLKSDFIVQQTIEKDESISILLHKGDVEAQILRWEFVALDENRTMLALTFWSAYSTARFAFRVLLSVMPESHLGAPVVFCSMYLEQFAVYIDNHWAEKDPNHKNGKPKADIPLFTKQLSPQGRQIIEALVTRGAVYLRTYQTVNIRDELHELTIGSTFDMIKVPFEQAAPYITDMDNLPDSIPFLKSIKEEKVPDGTWARTKFRFGKFPIMVPLSVHQVFSEATKNFMTFENPGGEGDLAIYSGAYEWSKMDSVNDATLYIFTHTLKLSTHANFIVRVLNKLMPDIESIEVVGEGLVAVETRKKWIEKKYQNTTSSRR